MRAAVEQSLKDRQKHEEKLRFVLGLAPSDDRFLRPIDQPPESDGAETNWDEARANALSKSAEIMRQRHEIEQSALELEAARKQLSAELQSRLGATMDDPDSLNMPLQVRRAIAHVRNLELALTRKKTRLAEEELNAVHLLSTALRNLAANSAISKTHSCRAATARDEVVLLTDCHRRGTLSLDILFDAQRRSVQAEQDYHVATSQHAIALKEVELRAGTLLERRGITIADVPSEPTN
jgi:outer membrane protein TolC